MVALTGSIVVALVITEPIFAESSIIPANDASSPYAYPQYALETIEGVRKAELVNMIINEKLREFLVTNFIFGFSALAKRRTETGNIIRNSNGLSYEMTCFASGGSSSRDNKENSDSSVGSNENVIRFSKLMLEEIISKALW